jgi:hypothetical protein
MDTITSYLQNPLKTGVYNLRISADFSSIREYLEEILKKEKKTYEEIKAKRKEQALPEDFFKSQEEMFSRYSEMLKRLAVAESLRAHNEDFFKRLNDVLRSFSTFNSFPESLGSSFYTVETIRLSQSKTFKAKLLKKESIGIFDSRIAYDIKDVFAVEKTRIQGKKWLFDVVSIKEEGVKAFRNCFESIPPISKSLEVIKEKQQFSTRYVFRPYALAAKLWLESQASSLTPTDLRSFLSGATNYVLSGEWRTSIVLSAICVESILADLYEEIYKKLAPDTPLGDLYRLVKERMNFPQDISKAIETTNEARISAVHRSRFPVSDKDALNALWGSTKLVLWYHKHY